MFVYLTLLHEIFHNDVLVKQEVLWRVAITFCCFSQFLCLKNIRAFLNSCTKIFDLKESVLFDAHELYDVSDFGKVKF